MQRYQVLDYTLENLVALFLEGSHASVDDELRLKPQIAYFLNYFDKLKIETLVYEVSYTDRHFLEDYSGYYSRCFTRYARFCSRIHVFNSKFGKRKLNNLIKSGSSIGQLGYKGFIVVKPLPQTVVGRTCLERPNHEEWDGEFPSDIKIELSLFGIGSTIQSSPFQEQDHEVAACATTALWTALASTGTLFTHSVPSPFEITNTAHLNSQFEHRSMPNEGLTASQIAQAISAVGLEPTSFPADSPELLRAGIYAYLRGGISPVLGIEFEPQKDGDEPEYHAVAVTGYHLGESSRAIDNAPKLKASRIDRLYVHDDGVGPYAPVEVKANNGECVLETLWKKPDGTNWNARPFLSMVALYHKIRTPFSDVYDAIYDIDRILKILFTDHDRLEWDIFLISNNQFKQEIKIANEIDSGYLLEIMTRNLPRFLWRVLCRVEGSKKLFEFVLDATDLRQGGQVVEYIKYDESICHDLSLTLNSNRSQLLRLVRTSLGRSIYSYASSNNDK